MFVIDDKSEEFWKQLLIKRQKFRNSGIYEIYNFWIFEKT